MLDPIDDTPEHGTFIKTLKISHVFLEFYIFGAT